MTRPDDGTAPGTPVDDARLEDILSGFERAWQHGRRPDLDEYLPKDGPLRQTVLVELIHADLECRLKGGEPARVEEYLRRYPELGADADVVGGLIAAEHEQRRRREPGLDPAEYAQRFPHLRDRLPGLLTPGVQESLSAPGTPAPSAADAPESATWPALPGYEILGELGRGGMGAVYRARHLGLNRLVALKMLLADDGGAAEVVKRFRREGQAMARLRHANIIQVYAVSEHEGRPFFAMELAEGGSLDRVAGTPWPPRRAAELVAALARAVQHAHERGILHRDLKPANVVLDAGGTPKITDFGLARDLGASAGQTPSNTILGTPAYMAPEQAGGKTREAGVAADVYALGAILYELLAGRPPFQAETALDIIVLVLSQEPVPPRRLQPAVAHDLETVCLKCLAKKPADRYESAQALAEDLGRFLAGARVAARSGGLRRAARRALEARKSPVVLGVAGALLAAALVIVGARHRPPAGPVTGRSSSAPATASIEGASPGPPAAGPTAPVRTGQGPQPAAEIPSRLKEKARPVPQLPRPLAMSQRAPVLAIIFAPEGKPLLSAGTSGVMRFWGAGAGEPQRPGWPRPATAAALAPDGEAMAVADGGELIHLGDLGGTLDRLTFAAGQGKVTGLAFGPDGKALASAGADGTVRVWDAATGRPLSPAIRAGAPVHGVAFSPDGGTVATAGEVSVVCVWAVSTGKAVRQFPARGGAVSSLAFSPDGTTLAAAGADGAIRLWEVSTGQGRGLLPGPDGPCRRVAFSPAGDLLASAGADHVVRLWSLPAEREVALGTDHAEAVAALAFSPAGTALASAGVDGTLFLWDLKGLDAGPPARPLKGDPWPDLADADALTAYRAVWALVRRPERAAALLRGRVQPVPPVAAGKVDRLITELGDERPDIRVNARAELLWLGEAAEAGLRQRLRRDAPEGMRRALERLLEDLEAPVPPSERLGALRAVEVLGYLRTAAAREELAAVAAGAPEVRLTRQAKAALECQQRLVWAELIAD
jgi:hypothetical protein